MDAAKVDHKLTIYIEPEVIIAGKFEDDIMAPGVLAAGRLREGSIQLHRKLRIHFLASCFQIVQTFAFAGITVRQKFSVYIIEVFRIQHTEITCLYIIIGEELAVLSGRSGTGIIGAQFLIYFEVVAIQAGEVLRTVILEVSGGFISTLDKEMIDCSRIRCLSEQTAQRAAAVLSLRYRISIILQICR